MEGFYNDTLSEILTISSSKQNTVKWRAVDRSTIQFWNFFAKGCVIECHRDMANRQPVEHMA